jgi:hypothetical protein
VHITYVAEFLESLLLNHPIDRKLWNHRICTGSHSTMGCRLVVRRRSTTRCTFGCCPPSPISPGIQTLVRTTSPTIHPYLPLPNNLRQPYPSARDSAQLLGLLAQACMALEGVSCRTATSQGALEVVEISANRNTWSRAARRRQQAAGTVGPSSPIDDNIAMVCFVHCARTEAGEFYLEASWAKGKDRSLFETFWSHTSRKVGSGFEAEVA